MNIKGINWKRLFGIKPKVSHPHITKTVKDIQVALQTKKPRFRATRATLNDGVYRSQQIADNYYLTGELPHITLLDEEPH